ncbi:MAG: anion permease [Phycisphaerales bacterium]|nr:anion permease [Phycisphaerales bacterium]
MRVPAPILATFVAVGLGCAVGFFPWHPSESIRAGTGLVVGALALWISESAPLGIIALLIPAAATACGLLTWKDALSAWGNPIIFLFFAAFLFARALEKFGTLDWVAGVALRKSGATSTLRACLIVLLISGCLSTFQNNTAIAAMLLPVTVSISRRTGVPALPLLALSLGATFGGMAAPVGTAPNFLGYGKIRELDSSFSFLTWLRVGVPVWLGTTVIALGVLSAAAVIARTRNGLSRDPADSIDVEAAETAAEVARRRGVAGLSVPELRRGRIAAVAAVLVVVTAWLTIGVIKSIVPADGPESKWIERYLPESLVALVVAWPLFMIPVGARGQRVLDRRDFQALDWDTLFLIAGGLCLGTALDRSGASDALANAVAQLNVPPLLLMIALGGVTVILSELTSNTATASTLVPIAGALAPALGMTPVDAIWLVALCASLGFALPISTPPNAIVYGTGLVPIRLMLAVGIVVDVLALLWVVACVKWFAPGA